MSASPASKQQGPETTGGRAIAKTGPKKIGPGKPDSPKEELESYLKGLASKFETGARPGKFARFRVWTENELFDRGQQLLTYNYNYGWQPWSEDDQDLYFIDNILSGFVEQATTEYTKSKPRLVVYSKQGDDRKTTAAVEKAQYMADCLQVELWSPEDLQRESKIVQFRSVVFTRTYFDPKDESETVEQPVYEQQQRKIGPDMLECANCGNFAPVPAASPGPQASALSGDPGSQGGPTGVNPGAGASSSPQLSDMPCPQCGAPGVLIHSAPTAKVKVQTGTKTVPAGKIKSDHIDPLTVEIYDRCYTVEDSPYLRWEEVELKSSVRAEYEDQDGNAGIDIREDSTDYGGVYGQTGLAFKRQLEVALGNSGSADANYGYGFGFGYGYGAGAQLMDELTCRHTRVYLDKSVYSDYTLNQEETIPGTDIKVPEGTRLVDVFTKGLKICMVNGQIVAAYNINKNDEWSGYKYAVSAASFYGRGIENMVPIQKWHNEAASLDIADAIYQSSGITLVDTTRIKDGKFANKPGTVVPIEDRLPGESMDDIVYHMEYGGAGDRLSNMRTGLKEDMQFVSGQRVSQVSGVPGPPVETATGERIEAGYGDASSGTKTELRAWCMARRIEQALKLAQTYYTEDRYWCKWGDTKGKWLSGLDIPGKLRVRFDADSHQPRTKFDVKTDSVQAINLGWGDPMTPPDRQKQLGTIFQMPTLTDDYMDWSIKAQKRLDDMILAAQMMQDRGVPDQAAIQFVIQQGAPQPLDDGPPPHHPHFIRFYVTEFYLSDQWQDAGQVVQQAVVQVVKAHVQAMQQPPQSEKPPAVSVNFKDVPDPNAQAQILQQAGIQADEKILAARQMEDERQQVTDKVQRRQDASARLQQLNQRPPAAGGQ